MVEGGFVVLRHIMLLPRTQYKANSLKPRPNLLDLKVQINRINVLVFVDYGSKHSFVSQSSKRIWGLPTRKAGNPLTCGLKVSCMIQKEVALHVTL